MADEKKSAAGPGRRKDLASKIAQAYGNAPVDPRGKPEAEDIENPELDQAFDKMVEMYKVRRPARENSVVSFPAPSSAYVPRPAPSGEDYECPDCGHENPAVNQFCGMCGAAREQAVLPAASADECERLETPLLAPDAGVRHHHHHYHHHHYRNNPYLLVAILLLLVVIAWQQWEWQNFRRDSRNETTPATQVQPQHPAPAEVTPSPAGAEKNAAPKPAAPPTARAIRPRAQVRTAASQARAPGLTNTAPPVLAPSVATPPLPTLPAFSNVPPPVAHDTPAATDAGK